MLVALGGTNIISSAARATCAFYHKTSKMANINPAVKEKIPIKTRIKWGETTTLIKSLAGLDTPYFIHFSFSYLSTSHSGLKCLNPETESGKLKWKWGWTFRLSPDAPPGGLASVRAPLMPHKSKRTVCIHACINMHVCVYVRILTRIYLNQYNMCMIIRGKIIPCIFNKNTKLGEGALTPYKDEKRSSGKLH